MITANKSGSPMATMQKLRAYQGPALFSYGFRPFFLFGAIYAGAMVPLWLAVFAGDVSLPTAFAPRDWHVHEMLFGYVRAVIAGFLLTAVPNWTGRLPIQGGPLAILFATWLAGRLADILRRHRLAIRAGDRRRLPAVARWRGCPRDRRRTQVEQPEGGRHHLAAGRRQHRISCRGAFRRSGGIFHAHRRRPRRHAGLRDRRTDRSEFYAQLACAPRAGTVARPLQSFRCDRDGLRRLRHDRMGDGLLRAGLLQPRSASPARSTSPAWFAGPAIGPCRTASC